jgi:hypothetical protein
VRAHAAAAVLALVLVSVPVPVLGVVTVVAFVPAIVPEILLGCAFADRLSAMLFRLTHPRR